MMKKFILWPILAVFMIPNCVRADQGVFDIDRRYGLIDSVKQTATQQGISDDVINQTVRSVAFIPSIVKSGVFGSSCE